jgi:predicted alpha/beta hydrolase family esterase
MTPAFLILHGLEGSGPQHWQTWLAGRLRDGGHVVSYPSLPEADHPRVEDWLGALDVELAKLPAETTVLCHSLGSLLWLHHAARRPTTQVGRALLVAPPQPDVEDADSVGFRPTPLAADGVAAAARETRLVCSTDDPWSSREQSQRIGDEAGIEITWLENAGHINTDAGYGPWPWVERWALAQGSAGE